ncbi:uncharacterized protein LOC106160862 [Lingula anatina]|uniref:Uncharacterized protein LOC106160862 n=1 Tax=Lingula anatina TaxID=7574 RepID=A0A1S3I4A0_LINAN|nr:uncharacterized protein LOC106160862 [Lingula anatina]|eukprot:XP_013393087.1 uncharacterized protein LOC106160862 [Lingula anatina]
MAAVVDRDGFRVRKASMCDADDIWGIVREEGWRPYSLQLIKAYIEIAKDGWWVAEIDGEIIGCVMLYSFNETSTFLGILIVKSKHRGKGIARALNAEADRLAAGRTISLIGSEAVIPMYLKWGYKKSLRGGVGKYMVTIKRIPLAEAAESKYEIKDYSEVDWKAILDYDTSFHAIPREHVLKTWFGIEDAQTKVLLQDGEIAGYGTIMPANDGFAVSPLYGETAEACLVLLKRLVAPLPPTSPAYLTIPDSSQAGQILLEANADTTKQTMYGHALETGDSPPLPKWSNAMSLISVSFCFL